MRFASVLGPLRRVLAVSLALLLAWGAGAAMVHAQTRAMRSPVPGAPAGVTAFLGVHVIPMDTERVLSGQTVLIQHGWIVALGPSSRVTVPTEAVRIDGRGKYLLPGLADMHAHIGLDHGSPEDRLFLWLAQGITTIRNLDYLPAGDASLATLDGSELLRLRARAAAGELRSPWIYTSGPWAPIQYLGHAVGASRANAPAPRLDSVAAYIAAYKAAGYDFIKVHDENIVVFDSVVAAAQRVGISVVGHMPGYNRSRLTLEQFQRNLAGMRSIEHMLGYRQALKTWGDSGSRCPMADSVRQRTPSPRACEFEGVRALAEMTQRAGAWNVPTMAHIDPTLRAAPGAIRHLQLKALQDAGAKLLLGTDAPLRGVDSVVPGHGDPRKIHRELQAFVIAGLTPYQALVAGTRNVAEYFGTLESTGTVAVGKRADLVLLDGNPLDDIRHSRARAGVMIGGRWLSHAESHRQAEKITAAAAASR